MVKISAFRLRHLAAGHFASLMASLPVTKPAMVEHFAAGLRRLNDVLAETELHDHYWVWGGLLLGWAREGAILPHDCLDADFAVIDADFERLVKAVPRLIRGGFRCDRCFVNNDGQITELTFVRHGARFEFFRMFPVATGLRYFEYSIKLNGITEVEAVVPRQRIVTFPFLGRTWRKHEDHDLELRSIYGSWKTPDPSWSYLDDLAIESRRPSRFSHFDWKDGSASLTGQVMK